MSSSISPELARLEPLLDNIDKLSPDHARKLHKLVQKYQGLQVQKDGQEQYLKFVNTVWPSFIEGKHHKLMARAFERVASGELKRLIINMPPRHTKSEFASYVLPSWFLGRFPEKKVIQTAHTAGACCGVWT